jgi:hypothetical protein
MGLGDSTLVQINVSHALGLGPKYIFPKTIEGAHVRPKAIRVDVLGLDVEYWCSCESSETVMDHTVVGICVGALKFSPCLFEEETPCRCLVERCILIEFADER